MKIEAILFDVIGTTVRENDPNTINNCLLQAFHKHGVPLDIETLKLFRGRDKKDIINTIITTKNLPKTKIAKILQSLNQNITDNLHNFSANDGAAELFEYLHHRNIKIGLGTGLPRDLFEKIMEEIHWKKSNFDYIGISNELPHGRPHPAMVLDMMKKTGVSNRTRFLKVGDTIADIQEGKNANVLTAVILSGTQPKSDLEKEKPDFMLQHLLEIKSIVD
jgi:phosphonoacetaldehyde hydrolase